MSVMSALGLESGVEGRKCLFSNHSMEVALKLQNKSKLFVK